MNFLIAKEVKSLDSFTMFGLIAAKQAIEKSNYSSSDAGVIVGTGVGGMHTLEEEHSKYINKGQRGVSPFYVPKMIPNIAGGQIAIKNNLTWFKLFDVNCLFFCDRCNRNGI